MGLYTQEIKGSSSLAGASAEGILQQTNREYCRLPCQLRGMGLDHVRLRNCDRTGWDLTQEFELLLEEHSRDLRALNRILNMATQ